jgi:hypothetical protein
VVRKRLVYLVGLRLEHDWYLGPQLDISSLTWRRSTACADRSQAGAAKVAPDRKPWTLIVAEVGGRSGSSLRSR